jgi:signal peptidase II
VCRLQERRAVATLTDGDAAAAVARDDPGIHRLVATLAVTVGVVVVDQLTKWWALHRLSSGSIHVVGTLDLQLSRNTGSAFSLFAGRGGLLAAIAVVLVVALSLLAWRAPTVGRAAIIGLILGGALGNLADRLFRSDHGAVVDFVALHFWPTFNVADAAITVGCALLVLSLLRAPRGG